MTLTPQRAAELDATPGLISEAVGLRLYELAAACTPGSAIIEIGSYKGRSAGYLGEGARAAGAQVVCIDRWDEAGNVSGRHGYAEASVRDAFDATIARLDLGHIVARIQGAGAAVAQDWIAGPIVELLYIDGSHLYEDVIADIAAWHPHLAPSATIVFDDYDTPKNPGVKQAVDEWLHEAAEQLTLDTATPPLAILTPTPL